jgi:DNA-binding PadR family transcriptional regulator
MTAGRTPRCPAGAIWRKMSGMMSGMMAVFLLWLIARKPAHGYELIRLLKAEHGSSGIGSAHVYPALADLSRRGLIKVRKVASGKRVKKLYSVTPSGRKKLLEMKKAHLGDGLRARFLKEMLG